MVSWSRNATGGTVHVHVVVQSLAMTYHSRVRLQMGGSEHAGRLTGGPTTGDVLRRMARMARLAAKAKPEREPSLEATVGLRIR